MGHEPKSQAAQPSTGPQPNIRQENTKPAPASVTRSAACHQSLQLTRGALVHSNRLFVAASLPIRRVLFVLGFHVLDPSQALEHPSGSGSKIGRPLQMEPKTKTCGPLVGLFSPIPYMWGPQGANSPQGNHQLRGGLRPSGVAPPPGASGGTCPASWRPPWRYCGWRKSISHHRSKTQEWFHSPANTNKQLFPMAST